jgi:hypothetical protein
MDRQRLECERRVLMRIEEGGLQVEEDIRAEAVNRQ